MLKLKNVSKFYYQNGMIATGFSRVNLELNIGEFVVITGESGSGKSTLLNVLSGLDTYEEGEMYIDGKETSHFNEEDFEEYRRKYVGNIFQNFNLVNSYTVYQNIELALLLNGESGNSVKEKVLGLIEKVGLTNFKNTKCSKLSGGQKQRVAIARALAKDTPIIVADEPTGNLDSESANGIVALLREISKEKLVIVVTHNIEQVELYATRLIKMYDGKIVEDRKLVNPTFDESTIKTRYQDISFLNKVKLAFRNTFNIPVKFILIFVVFLFVSTSIAGTYSSLEKTTYEDSIFGYNWHFSDISDSRIIVTRNDRGVLTDSDYENISKLENIDRIVKNDLALDNSTFLMTRDYNTYIDGKLFDINSLEKEIDYGRLPENDHELVYYAYDGSYVFSDLEGLLDATFYRNDYIYSLSEKEEPDKKEGYKVVGIIYSSDWSEPIIYGSQELVDDVYTGIILDQTLIQIRFNDLFIESNTYNTYGKIVANSNVPKGKCFVSESFDYYTKKFNCLNKDISIKVSGTYIDDTFKLNINKKLNKKNFTKLTGIKYSEALLEQIYVNPEDYDMMLNPGHFQSSVFVKDVRTLDDTNSKLHELGFTTLVIRDTLVNDGGEIVAILSMLKTSAIVLLIIALFFISYFIIKLVLKSRNPYFTTLRTLGATRKVTKQILDMELVINATISYIAFVIILLISKAKFVSSEYFQSMLTYLTPLNYILIYVAIFIMAILVANRFSKKLFKDSVMSTYREEV